MARRVYYIFDKKLLEVSKNITNISNRAFVVQSLIASYNLFEQCEVVEGEIATDDDLLSFHSAEYLNYLKEAQASSNLEELTDTKIAEVFNLGYDCPLFHNIYDFVRVIAGSSLSAAKKLTFKKNYNGGIPNDYICNAKECQPRSYLKYKYKKIMDEDNDRDIFELPMNLSLDESLSYAVETSKKSVVRKECHNRIVNKTTLKNSQDNLVKENHVQNVAINWFGGWHHAQRDGAEGFCYVNDVVISILHLLQTFRRILYIDLDIHHGNAVENAFLSSSRVFSLSLHKYEAGYYPATGSLDDVGEGNGKFYTANVPLKGGITDDMYEKVFKKIIDKIFVKFKPECIVVQCGADAIAGDPLGGFNITPVGMGKCLQLILEEKLPTLVLGGGGYNAPNVAKCWAHLTSVILNHTLSNDIPDNSYFHLFGPSFEINISPSLRRNENTGAYLRNIVDTILGNLDFLPDI